MSVPVTTELISTLRAKTGAGILSCKKALTETNGDIEAAITLLRKKGEVDAGTKSDRVAKEGLVDSYIHLGGKVGVLIEINCETDFVAKNDDFKQLSRDLCLHIAATNPVCVSREGVPAELIAKEREIAAASLVGKPANIIDKIVEGKLGKIYAEMVLLEQPFVKDDSRTVEQVIKGVIAKTGENIVVRRFVRYALGS